MCVAFDSVVCLFVCLLEMQGMCCYTSVRLVCVAFDSVCLFVCLFVGDAGDLLLY